MFKILSHKGNENQDDTEIHLILVRMAVIKKTNNKYRQEAAGKEHLYTFGGNVN
jgi:hypothetical protein